MNTHQLFRQFLLVLAVAVSAPCRADGFLLTPGGVEYRDLQAGSGAAATAGDVVTVHLTGWVHQQGPSGQAFLDTRREGEALKFLVGTPRVMPGWNEGVQGMRAGGRRLLRIPPEQGLGARSFEDVIPAHAPLVFIVELLEVRPAAR